MVPPGGPVRPASSLVVLDPALRMSLATAAERRVEGISTVAKTQHRSCLAGAVKLIGVGRPVRSLWESVLEEDDRTTIFGTPAWLDCLSAFGRYADATREYETETGEPVILPLARFGPQTLPTSVAAS